MNYMFAFCQGLASIVSIGNPFPTTQGLSPYFYLDETEHGGYMLGSAIGSGLMGSHFGLLLGVHLWTAGENVKRQLVLRKIHQLERNLQI